MQIADLMIDNEQGKNMDMDRVALTHQLKRTQQRWLFGPQDQKMCSTVALKRTLWSVLIALLVIVFPIVVVRTSPNHKTVTTPIIFKAQKSKIPHPNTENYTHALHKALLFFNAQKSGRLPKNNGIPWRNNSGLQDGSFLKEVKQGLIGGYYDAGDNIKFHFPMAFSMTMLSWTVIEYSHKYKSIGEYNHIRELIKWGTDYLLLTFNSTASTIDHVYSQVGIGRNGSTTPDDRGCWQRPDMSYNRPVELIVSGPDLAGEMAAALAAASIVFRDKVSYSKKLIRGATTLFRFARDFNRRTTYSRGNPNVAPYYTSTGFYDEYMWGAAWMYYATGNSSYLSLATNPKVQRKAKAFSGTPDLRVLSWDNKLPAALLLLTRIRIFLNPPYPYKDMLRKYNKVTGLTMCSYLRKSGASSWTPGGMIKLNHGRPRPLQYVANAAFLASLFADYMNTAHIPGWFCGNDYFSSDLLRNFAVSQVDYILGANPRRMSYVVGYSAKYPKQVHHRGASIPNDGKRYSCTGGWKWRDAPAANPNIITGAMVAGPDQFDGFRDVRRSYNYTEPTLAGNAGLVAALVSLTGGGGGVDKNTIFSAVISSTTKEALNQLQLLTPLTG